MSKIIVIAQLVGMILIAAFLAFTTKPNQEPVTKSEPTNIDYKVVCIEGVSYLHIDSSITPLLSRRGNHKDCDDREN